MLTEDPQDNKGDGSTEVEQPVADVGVSRREFEELRERISELEELVGKEFCESEDDSTREQRISKIGVALYNVQNRLEQVEDKEESEGYEPQTKIGKVQKLLEEDWSKLNCDGSVQTRTRKTRHGNVMSESINKKMKRLFSEVYEGSCQTITIHQAMQRLGDTPKYTYEEKDGYKKLSRKQD